MGNGTSDLQDWTLDEVRGLFLYYKEECFDFGVDRDTFDQLLQEFRAGLASQLWKKFDNTNSGLVNALECLAALVLTSKAPVRDKVDMFFNLFDLSGGGVLSYDELVILAASILSGAVKITGRGHLPLDSDMEKLVDQAYLDADKDLSGVMTLPDYRTWVNKHMDIQSDSLSINEVLILFDLLDEPNVLPDQFVDVGYHDDPDLAREEAVTTRNATEEHDYYAHRLLHILQEAKKANNRAANLAHLGNDGPRASSTEANTVGSLTLDHLHGYTCATKRNNLGYVATGEVVYPLAAIVVLSQSRHKEDILKREGNGDKGGDDMLAVPSRAMVRQRYYRGHEAAVSSLCVHPEGKVVATGEACTASPEIHVWDSETLGLMAVFKGAHRRAVGHLAFSPSGRYLASLGQDPTSLLVVYEWALGPQAALKKIAQCPIFPYDMCWLKGDSAIAAVGSEVIMWNGINARGRTVKRSQGDWGRRATRQVLYSAREFGGVLHTGTVGGQIYKWERQGQDQNQEGLNLVCVGGPTLHDGPVSCLWLCTEEGEQVLVSGSKDGVIKEMDGQLVSILEYNTPQGVTAIGEAWSIAVSKDRSRLAVGTRSGEVYELTKGGYHSLLTAGHFFGEILALDVHPSREEFVTGGNDGTVRLWTIEGRALLEHRRFESFIRAMAYSPDGAYLALGFGGRIEGNTSKIAGQIHVLNGRTLSTEAVTSDFKEPISVLRYSPDGLLLAVGCETGATHVYRMAGNFLSKKCTFTGLAAPVAFFDFSIDGRYLQVTDDSLEALQFLDTVTGAPVKEEETSPYTDIQWNPTSAPPVQLVEALGPAYGHLLSVDRTANDDLMILSSDKGKIIVTSNNPSAPSFYAMAYSGHDPVSPVLCRITASGNHCISVGTSDLGVMVWKLDKHLNDIDFGAPKEEKMEDRTEDALLPPSLIPRDPHLSISGVAGHMVAQHQGGWDFLLDDYDLKLRPMMPWRGAIHEPARIPVLHLEAPLQDLELDWVYGFNGRGVHRGLAMAVTGTVVYTAGRLGVVHSFQGKTQRFFQGHHQSDLTCMAVLSDSKGDSQMIATGEESNGTIMVWDITKATLCQVVTTNFRGIHRMAFYGSLLAVIGREEGWPIAVYDLRHNRKVAAGTTTSNQPADLCWLNDITIITCGDKFVTYWILEQNILRHKRGQFGRTCFLQPIECVTALDHTRALTGQRDGSLCLWDDKGNAIKLVEECHKGPIQCLVSSSKSSRVYSSGADGVVKVWSASVEELNLYDMGAAVTQLAVGPEDCLVVATEVGELAQIRPQDCPETLHNVHSRGGLWALATHPKKKEFVTAGDDANICVWDVVTKKLIQTKSMERGMRAVCFSPDGTLIVVGYGVPGGAKDDPLNGAFVVLDSVSLKEVYRSKIARDYVREVRFSPDGSLLAVVSNDATIYLYDAQDNYLERGLCKTGGAPVTHLDFTDDNKYFQINTDRYELAYMSSATYKKLKPGTAQMKDSCWATWTCRFGWPVQGPWAAQPEGCEVMAVDRSHDTHLLASVDDCGRLSLYQYPSPRNNAQANIYYGHGGRVSSCRWIERDTHLITTGGEDCCVLQWKMIPPPNPSQPMETTNHLDRQLQPINRNAVDTLILHDFAFEVKKSEEKAKRAVPTGIEFSEPSNPPVPQLGPPETDELELEHVFGYRAFDSHKTVSSLASGEIVFATATLVVIMDSNANTQRFYQKHTDEVISLAVHPDGNTVASTQVGTVPEIHVWDAVELKPLTVIYGFHCIGIPLIAFSCDGESILSAGQDADSSLALHQWRASPISYRRLANEVPGMLTPILDRWSAFRGDASEKGNRTGVFNKHGGLMGTAKTTKNKLLDIAMGPNNDICAVGLDYIRFWSNGLSSPGKPGIFAGEGTTMQPFLCAAFVGSQVVTGTARGEIYVWSNRMVVRVLREHRNSFVNVIFVSDNGMWLSGGSDGLINLWNLDMDSHGGFSLPDWRTLTSTDTIDPQLSAIRCLAGAPGGSFYIGTGASELLHWDPKSNDIHVLMDAHFQGQTWALATHPLRGEYVTAGDDRTVRVWDSSSHRQLRKKRMEASIRAIAYSPDGEVLVVGYGGELGSKDHTTSEEDGAFVVLNAATLELIYKETKFGCKEAVLDLKFSSDGSLLVAASADCMLHLYQVQRGYNKKATCLGHSQMVTQLDISEDGKYVQSTSNADELYYWNTYSGKQVKNRASELRDVKWSTWTIPVGWPIQALSQAASLNRLASVDRSKDGRLVAGLDEYGKLRLYNYPCFSPDSQPYSYRGHGLRPAKCRWTYRDTHLVTLGASDRTIMQWRHIKTRIPPTLAQTLQAEPNSDVELEHPTRSIHQDAINEGYTYTPGEDGGSEDNFVAVKPWVGVVTAPSAVSLPNASKTPSCNLQLNWVHGYDGQRLRNQVQYTVSNQVVYSVGSVAVIYDPATHRQRFFLSHTDDIISLAVSPNGHYIATGQLGLTPRIYVWDSRTLSEVSLLRGRLQRGVSQLAFSGDGSLLACVSLDEERTLAVYLWRDEKVVSLGKVGKQAKVLCLAFSKDNTTIAVGTAMDITFHTLNGTRYLRRRRGVMGKKYKIQPVLSCCYLPTGQCVSGMLDGSLYFWDGNICKGSIPAHIGPVYSLVVMGPTLVTGGDDGVVKLWEAGLKAHEVAKLKGRVKSLSASAGRTLVIATHQGQIWEMNSTTTDPVLLVDGHEYGSIMGLATHPSILEFATGGRDQWLQVWDAHERRLLKKKMMEAPVSAVAYSPDGSLLAVGYGSTTKLPGETESDLSGMVLVLNAHTLEVVCKDNRAQGWIRALRFSQDGSLLAAASNDRSIYMYEVTTGFKRVYNYKCTCKGHTAPVTHLDFTSGDGANLQSSSMAHELLYWNTSTGKQLPHGAIELRDAKWDTWTVPYGWPVQGLWPEVADGVEVTSVDRAKGGDMIAAVDNYGRIRVFSYPCNKPGALELSLYGGHSPLIANCRWSVDDLLLITTGGTDKAVLQWRWLQADEEVEGAAISAGQKGNTTTGTAPEVCGDVSVTTHAAE